MWNPSGKRVLITGGSSGIGLAIARAMAASGATVTITGRDPDKLAEVTGADPARGDASVGNSSPRGPSLGRPSLTGLVCDVTDEAAIVALRDRLVAEGGIDVLVNNAGIMKFFRFVDRFPIEEQVREIDIDVIGPIRMTEHFLPSLLERESLIVNVSSGLAYVPYTLAPVYSGCKAFVHAYTQCLRRQLEATSVRVVELLPPVVDTPLARGIAVESPFPMMAPEKLASALMRGLRRGRNEIAPGPAGQLKWLSRFAPRFIFRQLNREQR
jgi:uncharacterized oxidoreductase